MAYQFDFVTASYVVIRSIFFLDVQAKAFKYKLSCKLFKSGGCPHLTFSNHFFIKERRGGEKQTLVDTGTFSATREGDMPLQE